MDSSTKVFTSQRRCLRYHLYMVWGGYAAAKILSLPILVIGHHPSACWSCPTRECDTNHSHARSHACANLPNANGDADKHTASKFRTLDSDHYYPGSPTDANLPNAHSDGDKHIASKFRTTDADNYYSGSFTDAKLPSVHGNADKHTVTDL